MLIMDGTLSLRAEFCPKHRSFLPDTSNAAPLINSWRLRACMLWEAVVRGINSQNCSLILACMEVPFAHPNALKIPQCIVSLKGRARNNNSNVRTFMLNWY